ncbi:hypothetical protein AB0H34_46245, partial [Saccharopolyspora shandongensis]
MQPYELTVAAAAAEMRAGRLSPVELVDSVLGRIEQVEPRLQAYVSVLADRGRPGGRAAPRIEGWGKEHELKPRNVGKKRVWGWGGKNG